jgi:hypothetical protein
VGGEGNDAAGLRRTGDVRRARLVAFCRPSATLVDGVRCALPEGGLRGCGAREAAYPGAPVSRLAAGRITDTDVPAETHSVFTVEALGD